MYTYPNMLSSSYVAVSCGYDTCFAVKTCDGLYHFIISIAHVGIPFGFQTSLHCLSLFGMMLHYVYRPWDSCACYWALTKFTHYMSVSPPYYPWVTATLCTPSRKILLLGLEIICSKIEDSFIRLTIYVDGKNFIY